MFYKCKHKIKATKSKLKLWLKQKLGYIEDNYNPLLCPHCHSAKFKKTPVDSKNKNTASKFHLYCYQCKELAGEIENDCLIRPKL